MLMFGDILWRSEDNEQECIANATLVSLFAKRFPAGRWSSLGPGSETKWYSTNNERKTYRGEKNLARKTVAWSFDMEGHAQKGVERYCEPANKKVEQLYQVSSPSLDDHQFKQEELECVGEMSEVFSQIVLQCLYLARIGRPEILWDQSKNGLVHVTDGKEETERASLLVEKQDFDQVETGRSTTLGISSDTTTGNGVRENVLSFEALASKIQLTQFVRKTLLSISCGSREAVQNSTR